MQRVLVLALVVLHLGCFKATVREETFFRPAKVVEPALDEGLQRRGFEVTAEDGAVLRGRLVETPESTRAILFFYGNQESVMGVAGELDMLANRYRADVLCVDYRGYGMSPPKFREGQAKLVQVQSDALSVYDAFKAREGKKGVVVLGYSLGAALATHVAAERPVGGVVLMAAGTSFQDMVDAYAASMPWYARAFVTVRVDPHLAAIHPQPLEEVAKIRAPLLSIHGTEDEAVRFPLGQKLFAAATGTDAKRFCPIEGADHELALDDAAVRACLDRFLGAPMRR